MRGDGDVPASGGCGVVQPCEALTAQAPAWSGSPVVGVGDAVEGLVDGLKSMPEAAVGAAVEDVDAVTNPAWGRRR